MRLLQAYESAQQLARDVWDFAVELRTLEQQGLTHANLRFLTAKGYLQHARRVSSRGAAKPKYEALGAARFTRRTCFVLTEAGLVLARAVCREAAATDPLRPADATNPVPAVGPHYDSVRRILYYDGRVAKRLQREAPVEERLLLSCQAQKWKKLITDPLDQVPGTNPKKRLHDAVRNLNRAWRKKRFASSRRTAEPRSRGTPRRALTNNDENASL